MDGHRGIAARARRPGRAGVRGARGRRAHPQPGTEPFRDSQGGRVSVTGPDVSHGAAAGFGPSLPISFAARSSATSSACAAATFTSGSTPVPSQLAPVIGLTERAYGTRTEK